MAKNVTKDAVNLEADARLNFTKRCQHAIAKQNNFSSVVPVDTIPISEKTLDRYIKEGFLERQATLQDQRLISILETLLHVLVY